MLSWLPITLALITVQRQTAASRSAKSLIKVQQGVFGGFPTTTWTRCFNKSTHAPSFNVSFGQLGCFFGGLGVGVGGFGAGAGAGGHGAGTLWELTLVNKRILKMRRRVMKGRDLELEAIYRKCVRLDCGLKQAN